MAVAAAAVAVVECSLAAALLTVPTVACAACATGWWPHKRRTTTATAGSEPRGQAESVRPSAKRRAARELHKGASMQDLLGWGDKHVRFVNSRVCQRLVTEKKTPYRYRRIR